MSKPFLPPVDADYLKQILADLLATPSPTGMTDAVVHRVCTELTALGIPYGLTRRGAIRADIEGSRHSPDRAVAAHLDTLGAMVKGFKDQGRLRVVPIGTWSARFAEGARVTVFSDWGKHFRGTILPAKASGHTFGDAIDSQPSNWDNLEIRLDEPVGDRAGAAALGINVGDTVAVDSAPEFLKNGFVNARHLDDKAGVAAILAAAKAVIGSEAKLWLDCHLLFTISEEVGVGASHVMHGDVAELVSVDNGTVAEGQNTSEFGATIAMQDSSGPFDWYLTRALIDLARRNDIPYSRDVFRYYRSDAASAVEAGNDIRTALLCFGLDASHGFERVHMDSLIAVAQLLVAYMLSPPLFERDEKPLGPIGDFPAPDVQTER